MARQDSRRRGNRAKITTTKQRQRTVDGGTTEYTVPGTRWSADRTTSGRGMFHKEGSYYSSDPRLDDGDKYLEQDASGNWRRFDGQKVDVSFESVDPYRYGVSHNFIRHNAKVSIDNPDKTVADTVTTNRMQSLDKRSGSDDAQKQRSLKTKKDGRNKLRIQLSGDASSGRLKGGPNSNRKGNKLKIDVQGSGGNTGLNVPR